MPDNLLRPEWTGLDSFELRLLLDERIGGPGQYDRPTENPDDLYLPLAGEECCVRLTFRGSEIASITPGPAFDAGKWDLICEEIEKSILAGPIKVARNYSFSGFRVLGSWRGERSGVQILPPPSNAPRAPIEIAEHPFILEFPTRDAGVRKITQHRRLRDHRKLTFLLNALLVGRISIEPPRPGHVWAYVRREDGGVETTWVQQGFFAGLGAMMTDDVSPPSSERLDEINPDEYYARSGHDGKGLTVPTDLDELICRYVELSPTHRAKFDRAAYWLDMASFQWEVSFSVSFNALVTAVESLTERGEIHRFNCPSCSGPWQHEVPGATQRFREFLETHAPAAALSDRRSKMYGLRSGITHGSSLMEFDHDRAFGWDPPWWNERELHEELWGLVRVALRNWLRDPPAG